jgi:carbon storage regulator
MLCLSRRIGETIKIGDGIEIKVLEIRRGGRLQVRLGITCPREIPIARDDCKTGPREKAETLWGEVEVPQP